MPLALARCSSIALFQCLWICFKCDDSSTGEAGVAEDRQELVFGQHSPHGVVLDQYKVEGVLADVEGTPNELLQVADLLVTLDREVIQDAALARVKWHPEELLLDQLDLRDWQRDVHVGFEGD